MHEAIRKNFEFKKQEVDMYYASLCKTETVESAVECIYCIGEAASLVRILEVDYGEDLKQEKRHLNQIKNRLKDTLNIIVYLK